MQKNNSYDAIFFDLDGTLLNTAPDLVFALNQLRDRVDLPPVEVEDLMPFAGTGVVSILSHFMGVEKDTDDFKKLCDDYLLAYGACMAKQTHFYDGIEKVLDTLDQESMPWGIVTNKLTAFTMPQMDSFGLKNRAAAIVCGDTLPFSKPHPAPVLHACKQLPVLPQSCLFVGDSVNDVLAGRRAGMATCVAAYGYIPTGESAHDWDGDFLIDAPLDLLTLLREK